MAKKRLTRAEKIRLENIRRQRKRARQIELIQRPVDRERRIAKPRPFIERGLIKTERIARSLVSRASKVADPLSSAALLASRLSVRTVKQLKLQQKAQVQIRQHVGIADLIPSSFIHYLFYHVREKVAQVRLMSRNYYYTGIPANVFDNWFEGRATVKTNDTSSLKRWKIGDTPSLGAFYNDNIKGKYPSHVGIFRP